MTTSEAVPRSAVSRYWHPRQVDPAQRAEAIRRLLVLARKSLGMEVGYFGTFSPDEQTYEVVDGQAESGHQLGPVQGSRTPLNQTLCWQVVTGRMGSVVPDTRAERVTRELPPVTEQAVGAYLGVPVHADGELLGMLCVISEQPRPGLSAPDLETMRLLAEVVALELTERGPLGERERIELDRLREALDPASHDPVVLFQPTARIAPRLRHELLEVRSVEALSRFSAEPTVPVEHWFELAWRHGLGVDLELAAIERALDALPLLPEPLRLAVNASPETLASSRLRDALPAGIADRVVIELTEHVLLEDYEPLRPALARLRGLGVALAIDDLGTGSSNLQHVLELSPDMVKVDLSITSGVEHDLRRRALMSALVTFARDVGIVLVAEGVERVETARELVRLGVEVGQGWWLSRPLAAQQLPDLACLRPVP